MKTYKRVPGIRLTAAPPMFALPCEDDPEFRALPASVRREVRVWCGRIAKIWNVRPVTPAIVRLARSRRVGYTTIIKKYYKLRRGMHWRALVNHRKLTTGLRTLRLKVPPAGVQIAVISSGPNEIILQIRPARAAQVGQQ